MFRRFGWIAAVAWIASSASAQSTWWVDDDAAPGGNGSLASPFQRIQQGIGACAPASGDTVVVRPGTYAESVDYLGKQIAVVSELGPAGQGVTTIRGSQSGSVVLMSGASPMLAGFTVENGSGSLPPVGPALGGGIQLRQTTSAWVVDCTIRNNFAERGGGVGSYLGAGLLERCLIENNQAATSPGACTSGDGGGVWGPVTLVLRDCTVRGNRAVQSGGGIWGCSLERGSVEDNVSADGAGFSHSYASGTLIQRNLAHSCDGSYSAAGGADASTLEDCTLLENQAWDEAGGARNSTLLGCRVESNAATAPLGYFGASGGGALGCDATDSTFVDNWVVGESVGLPPGQGGGAAGGSALRCVFRGNRADIGAGTAYTDLDRCVVFANEGVGSELGGTLASSIVRGNSAGSLSGSGAVAYSDIEGGWAGTGNIDADPLFWNPAGGDFHLQPSSPCIDAGDPAASDPDGSRADMGAFPYSSEDCLEPVVYCTAGTSSGGCTPSIHASGTASASASSGFVLGASALPGQKWGVVLYGIAGEVAAPWGGTSTLCMAGALQRTGLHPSGGTLGACDGAIAVDWNAWRVTHPSALGAPFVPGQVLWAQVWYRDTAAPPATALSNAVRVWICP